MFDVDNGGGLIGSGRNMGTGQQPIVFAQSQSNVPQFVAQVQQFHPRL
jgi:hypothetical protein